MQNSLPGNPLVSVLMPVYNGIDTIKYAIKSLQLQTYSNWELIVVNDGSTDGTGEYLNQLKLDDNRCKIIHLDRNRGRGFARNVCLENVTGDYIAFLDADDIYLPNKIEKQLQFLIKNPEISLVGCGVGILEKGYEIRFKRPNRKFGEKIEYKEFDSVLFLHPTVMIRSLIASKCNYKSYLDALEDEDFFRQYLKIGKSYFKLEDILYLYDEFQTLSKRKIIYYGYNSLIYYGKLMFENSRAVNFFLLTLIKLSIKIVMLAFVKASYFVKNRNIFIDENSKIFIENYLVKLGK